MVVFKFLRRYPYLQVKGTLGSPRSKAYPCFELWMFESSYKSIQVLGKYNSRSFRKAVTRDSIN